MSQTTWDIQHTLKGAARNKPTQPWLQHPRHASLVMNMNREQVLSINQ
jgi:hypothetical protein